MDASGAGRRPPAGVSDVRRRLRDGWDIATVVAEFDVLDDPQSAQVSEQLFADDDVLTVRVGGPGERSVYRVDVPRGHPEARSMGAAPALRAAAALGVDVTFVRIGITPDGLGDPEGAPPPADALPWAGRRGEPG